MNPRQIRVFVALCNLAKMQPDPKEILKKWVLILKGKTCISLHEVSKRNERCGKPIMLFYGHAREGVVQLCKRALIPLEKNKFKKLCTRICSLLSSNARATILITRSREVIVK